jgi:DNA modification methylase
MTKELIGGLELNRIYQRDCLEGMRMLPDDSVDLIIADPPYYKIKGDFDFKWRTMDDYLAWCADWLKECERVLSPQGSLYIYGVELQLEYLAVKIANTTVLEYRNRITLNKQQSYIKDLYGSQEHFRRFIPSAEFLLFYTFKDETGTERIRNDDSYFAELRDYIKSEARKAFKKTSEMNTYLGFRENGGMATRKYLGKTQWHLPTEEHYIKLQKTGHFSIPYDEIKERYGHLRSQYESERITFENERYTFNAKDGMTNVWDFEPDRGKLKTKHPTQKPLEICERIISVSSNEGNTVLIPFVGSGSECVAAKRANRKFIGFEIEQEFIEIANKRLDNEEESND